MSDENPKSIDAFPPSPVRAQKSAPRTADSLISPDRAAETYLRLSNAESLRRMDRESQVSLVHSRLFSSRNRSTHLPVDYPRWARRAVAACHYRHQGATQSRPQVEKESHRLASWTAKAGATPRCCPEPRSRDRALPQSNHFREKPNRASRRVADSVAAIASDRHHRTRQKPHARCRQITIRGAPDLLSQFARRFPQPILW